MLMPLSGFFWWWWCCCCWYCCGGCYQAPQMFRHQGLLKCRCRMLFNDLKVFLLRRPPPAPLPMHGDPQPPGLAANNNTLPALGAGGWVGWRGPREGASGEIPPLPPPPPLPPSSAEDDWGGQVVEPPASLLSSTSSDDFCKGKAEDRYSLGSSLDSGMRTPLCRICFQGPEQGELLSPCRCDGSVKCTHQPCLIKWISERGCWSCELCYYKYHVIAISTKNPLQWQAISLTVIEKVQIAAAILGSLFLIASISWLIWSTFSPSAKWQRQDLLFQICYGMYGFMDVVCIGLIIHEGPSVYRIFKRWQAVNQQWKVLNYDKTKDLEDQKAGGRTNPRTSSSTPADAAAPSEEEAVSNPSPGDGTGSGGGNRAPSQPSGPLADHHCAYTILHILSHLRPHEQRSSPGGNRELVMRVTTV
ncbi:E3 ubiquitin-protein ligase MARCHF4 [Dromiciops gliroides]|uniref:E3 ubiquitin-protein ligase MARCHF4 n=1 Tax=Dromiciops gliroides TaxID=33562 RepID=UPI001CC59C98|nr:E3 ubiquitin-protein ligase MARCHF4 [Dromiciops gliroides]